MRFVFGCLLLIHMTCTMDFFFMDVRALAIFNMLIVRYIIPNIFYLGISALL